MVDVRVDKAVYEGLEEELLRKIDRVVMSRSVLSDGIDINDPVKRKNLIEEVVKDQLPKSIYSEEDRERYVSAVLLDFEHSKESMESGEGYHIRNRAGARGQELRENANPDKR